MSPALVWNRLAGCFLAGVLLGPAADFFRPLHRRFPVLTQLVISGEFFACWLWTGFGICRGDLRPGYFIGTAAGFLLWEQCFGRFLSAFYGKIWNTATIPLIFFRKIFRKISNSPFARRQKWSTMRVSNRQFQWRRSGGTKHGKDPQLSESIQASVPSHIDP